MGFTRCVERRFAQPHCQGREARDPIGQRPTGEFEVLGVDDVIEQTDGLGFVGLQGAPGQENFLGAGFADEFAQTPRGSGCGKDAQTGLRVADLRRRGADAEVRGESELGTAAEGESLDQGDDRHRQFLDAGEDLRVDSRQGIITTTIAQLRDIGTGREDTGGAGEDRNLRFGLEFGTHRVEGIDHRLVDGVADLRPVESDDRAVEMAFDEQRGGGIVHAGAVGCTGCRIAVHAGGAVRVPAVVPGAHTRSSSSAEP